MFYQDCCCTDPFNFNRVIARIKRNIHVVVRIRTILWCRADPGMRIRARRTAIRFFMMTRGSGSADPGVRIRCQKFYDDARIRRVRIRASELLSQFLYDDARIRGVCILASEPLSGKLWWRADPGVRIRASRILLRGLYSQFYFWVHTWCMDPETCCS